MAAARKSGKPRKAPACLVTAWAKQVAAGKIVAGHLTRLACQRHLEDLESGKSRGLIWDAPADQNGAADLETQGDAPDAIAKLAPATVLEDAPGAIIEPGITEAVDLRHPSVDANPRAGTSAAQNATDWNDPARARPSDDSFAGQGIDRSVYGTDPD